MPTWGVLKDGWEPAKESEGEKGFFGRRIGNPMKAKRQERAHCARETAGVGEM